MPLTSWLRALLPQRNQPETSPAPEPAAGATLVEPPVDNGVRMHIAASDPEFPAKREAAFDNITAAIDRVAAAHGFTKKAKSWAKSGPLGTVTLHLQRSRYGFDCNINLGFQPLSDTADGPWVQDDFIRLGRFFPTDTFAASDPGILIYLDVFDDPTSLTTAMQILKGRALPWLTAHLTDPDAPTRPFQR